MSIYPVRLNEWFPVGDEHYMGDLMEVYKCNACGRIPNYKKAVGHHSLPWGNGDIWCRERCMKSGRVHKMDKRQQRTWNRRYADYIKDTKKQITRAIEASKKKII